MNWFIFTRQRPGIGRKTDETTVDETVCGVSVLIYVILIHIITDIIIIVYFIGLHFFFIDRLCVVTYVVCIFFVWYNVRGG